MNTAINKTTTKALCSYLPLSALVKNRNDSAQTQRDIRETIEREQKKYKRKYDRRHYKVVEHHVGNIVLVRRVFQITEESTKTQSRYRDSLVVV